MGDIWLGDCGIETTAHNVYSCEVLWRTRTLTCPCGAVYGTSVVDEMHVEVNVKTGIRFLDETRGTTKVCCHCKGSTQVYMASKQIVFVLCLDVHCMLK